MPHFCFYPRLRQMLIVACAGGFLMGSPKTSKAGNLVENEEAYKKSDAELTTIYQDILSEIKKPEAKESFIKAERVWIEFRDAEAAAETEVALSKNATNKDDLNPAKTSLTAERIQALQRFKASLH